MIRFVAVLGSLLGLLIGAQAADEHVILITIDGFPSSLFWDQKISLPTLRRLASEGAVAEGMRAANPTVTWPNHTTLVTGLHPATHSVLFNGIVSRGEPSKPLAVDPEKTKEQLVAVPNLFDRLHARRLRTASVNWPCTRGSASIDDDFPDTPGNPLHSTPALRAELVARGILLDEKDATFRTLSGPARDRIWTESACLVFEKRKPAFMAFHLLNTDGIHHRYGPGSSASQTALSLADAFVGRLLESVRKSGLAPRTTLIVTADHGFAGATRLLQPNVLLRKAGLLELNSSNQISRARVQVISEGGSGFIYLNNPATLEQDRKQVVELFKGREGIAQIVEPSGYGALGLPSPEKNPGMADLVIAARDGYGVSASAVGDDFVVPITGTINEGYHGYLSTNPKMNALFMASGPAIKRGVKLGTIDNVDVAPTIAAIFGLTIPTDGRVLREILVKRR